MAPPPDYAPQGDGRSTPPPTSPAGQSFFARVIVWCRRRWWLGLPLLLMPVAWLVRLLRRHEPVPSGETTMTREQAEDARAEIDRRADEEIEAIHRDAQAGRDALRDRFGGR